MERVMTNEEAKTFLDNLKVCIEEHPIVADWLVEIADRKTEQTEPQRTEAKSIEDMSINEARSEFTRLKAFAEGYQKGKEDEHRWWSNHCANCTDYKDEPQTDCSWK